MNDYVLYTDGMGEMSPIVVVVVVDDVGGELGWKGGQVGDRLSAVCPNPPDYP